MPNEMQLWPFQKETVEWLKNPRDNGFGFTCEPLCGLIGHEMSLGKTACALEAIKDLILSGKKILFLVPGATKIQWQKQYDRWINDCEPDEFGTTSLFVAKGSKTKIPHGFSCVCSHAMLAKVDFVRELVAANFDGVVIDEIHKFGGRDTKRSKHLWTLINLTESKFASARIGLSGTPVRNYAEEIYNIWHFIAPHACRNFKDFSRKYLSWDHKSLYNPQQFHDDFRPFYLRYTIAEVKKDMPPIRRTKLFMEISDPFLARTYNKELDLMSNFMNNAGKVDSFSLLGYLQRLRHITGLAKAADDAVVDPIYEYLTEGEIPKKIVIGYHHTLVVKRLMNSVLGTCKCGKRRMSHFELTDELKEVARAVPSTECHGDDYVSAIPFYVMRGGMTDEKKEQEKQAFITCPAPSILLLNIKAAGEGVDGLQFAASKSIVLERQWNGADELQFEKRIHRPGQTLPCEVEYALAMGTVDEFFDALVDEKRRITTQVEDENYESNPAFLKTLAERVIQNRLPVNIQKDVDMIMESAQYDLEQFTKSLEEITI